MERLTEKVFGCVQIIKCGNDLCGETCEEHTCKTCPISEAIDKLAEYEDAEEQGLLVKLPCAVGSSVYHAIDNHIHEYKVIGLVYDICNKKWIYEVAHQVGVDWIKTVCRFDYIGKTVFLTREEAEHALKQMGEQE